MKIAGESWFGRSIARVVPLVFGIFSSMGQAAGPVDKFYRHNSGGHIIHFSGELPYEAGSMRVYVVDAKIEEFIKLDSQYGVVDGLIASTNITLNLDECCPLVQKTVIANMDTDTVNKLRRSFKEEQARRLVSYSQAQLEKGGIQVYLTAANDYFYTEIQESKPTHYCFIATDAEKGGTATDPQFVNFNNPERVAKQVTACVLKMSGKAKSVVIPLIGAASNGLRSESERICRMRHAFIGVVSGIQDFSVNSALGKNDPNPSASPTIEIGIVVYDNDLRLIGIHAEEFSKILESILDTAVGQAVKGKSSTGLPLNLDCAPNGW